MNELMTLFAEKETNALEWIQLINADDLLFYAATQTMQEMVKAARSELEAALIQYGQSDLFYAARLRAWERLDTICELCAGIRDFITEE